MGRKINVTDEIERAIESAQEAETTDELRMAQSVIIPGLLGASDSLAGKIIGRSKATVLRLRKQFKEICSGAKREERNWGGRRYGYMSIEEEREFLSSFSGESESGNILNVSEIKQAFESKVGRTVAKTTIYRMLERHGWRKIAPRPRHPKSDPEAQEQFKKNSNSS